MAKLKRKYIKMAVEEQSELSFGELVKKLDDIIDRQYRRDLMKLKSSPVFIWGKNGYEGGYTLRFYHSFKEDMCDTMMTLEIEKGLERSNVFGYIHKPKAIWVIFWGIIATLLIDFLIISWCLLFAEGFDLVNGLMISGCACLVRAYICISLLEINRDRVKNLRGELLRVIRGYEQAELFRQKYEDSPEDFDDFRQSPEKRPDDGVEIIDDNDKGGGR